MDAQRQQGNAVQEQTGQMAADIGRAMPSVSVAGLVLWGISLQDWVLIATLVYTTSLFLTHAWKNWIKPWREARKQS
jgi:hypothetical protein